jgi:ketopantoate reductase
MEKQREINSEYLIGRLLSTSHMNANLVSRTSTLHRRFKKHIINAVLGPSSIMREWNNAQIFADPDGIKIVADLIMKRTLWLNILFEDWSLIQSWNGSRNIWQVQAMALTRCF